MHLTSLVKKRLWEDKMTKIPDLKFPLGTHPKFWEFYDYTRIILNDGRYQLRIVNDEPNWTADDGEMVLYDPQAEGYRKSLYIYITDGWYRVTFLQQATSGGGGDRFHNIGEIFAWGGDHTDTDEIPPNCIVCNGAAVSRTTYEDLYAVTGESFGSGDGLNTFNVPDLRGRFPLGADNMGGSSANNVSSATADTIGGTGGAYMRDFQHSHNSTWQGGNVGSGYGSGVGPEKSGNQVWVAMGEEVNSITIMNPYQTVAYLIQA